MAGRLTTWLQKALTPLPVRQTPAPLADWGVWRDPHRPRTDVATLIQDGYQANSAVYACVQALARAFPEPPLKVFEADGKTEVVDHPLVTLWNHPNPLMGRGEMAGFAITYAAIGGNAYFYKNRVRPGQPPAELWPYHAAQLAPVATRDAWIDHFAYDLGNAQHLRIEPGDIVHWKWAVDPSKPWLGLPPLVPVVREMATDSELTRYLQALLTNDAVPRGLLKFPAGSPMPQNDVLTRMKEEWNLRFGGARRGGVGFLYGGAEYVRVAMDLQELALDALRGVPESRIAGAFGVPAIVAGLSIGLARSTYANFAEARKAFTEQTLVPLWVSLASELTADLLPEFDTTPGRACRFDTQEVIALREGEDLRYKRMTEAYTARIITLNEARQALGYEAIDGGDELAAPPAPPALPPPAAAPAEDAQDMGDMGGKALPRGLGAPPAPLEARLERAVRAQLEQTYRAVAAHVEAHG